MANYVFAGLSVYSDAAKQKSIRDAAVMVSYHHHGTQKTMETLKRYAIAG